MDLLDLFEYNNFRLFFISKSLIKVLGINSYIVIISAVSGQFVSFIKEKYLAQN